MTQDFAKSAKRGHQGQSQIPTWVWFLTGFVSGFFVAFLIFLDGFVEPDQTVSVQTAIPEKTASGDELETIDFDFYEIFPNVEVPLVEEFTAGGDKVKVEEASAYMLQVGSFKNEEDADKLRGKLLLMGLEVFSKEVKIDGAKWHRVLIGPLESMDQLNKKQQELAEENIESIPQRVTP